MQAEDKWFIEYLFFRLLAATVCFAVSIFSLLASTAYTANVVWFIVLWLYASSFGVAGLYLLLSTVLLPPAKTDD